MAFLFDNLFRNIVGVDTTNNDNSATANNQKYDYSKKIQKTTNNNITNTDNRSLIINSPNAVNSPRTSPYFNQTSTPSLTAPTTFGTTSSAQQPSLTSTPSQGQGGASSDWGTLLIYAGIVGGGLLLISNLGGKKK